jgi:hypothetical protein
MSDLIKAQEILGGQVPKGPAVSDMNPPIVTPLSEDDPSVAPDWEEHVQEYFNQDAHPGEAVPMATHEAKE